MVPHSKKRICLLAAALGVSMACAHATDQQKAAEEAQTKGKYAVRLTEDLLHAARLRGARLFSPVELAEVVPSSKHVQMATADGVELQAKAHIVDFEADVRTNQAKFDLEKEKLVKLTQQLIEIESQLAELGG